MAERAVSFGRRIFIAYVCIMEGQNTGNVDKRRVNIVDCRNLVRVCIKQIFILKNTNIITTNFNKMYYIMGHHFLFVIYVHNNEYSVVVSSITFRIVIHVCSAISSSMKNKSNVWF